MPQLFAAAVAAIGGAVGGLAGATLIMSAVQIGTALYYITALAISNAYSKRKRSKAQAAARDAYNNSLQDRLQMVSMVDGARSRVYGRVRNCEGVLFKATRGAHSEIYTLIIAVAGHEVDAIEQVLFDDEVVTLDANGWVTAGPGVKTVRETAQAGLSIDSSGNGSVTLPYTPLSWHVSAVNLGSDNGYMELMPYASLSGNTVTVSGAFAGSGGWSTEVTYDYERNISKARVRKYLGGPTQSLAADVSTDDRGLFHDFPSLVTADDRFAGIACLRVDLEYDTDVWPTGVPLITAVVRGARVYDPRTGVSAWSENPALIARDWAINAHGGGATSANLVAATFNTAANDADVSHSFATAGGSTVRPLFTCGIVCKTDVDPAAQFDEIVESMAGRWGWSGGKLRVRAGVYHSPVGITIDESWLSGAQPINIVPEPPASEAVNTIRATIADAAQRYQVVPVPPYRADAYIAADGRELAQQFAYAAVTDTDHAGLVSGIKLREARSGMATVLPCNLRALQLDLFDVVPVSLARYGWVNKPFEVVDWQFSLTGGVVPTLRETGASLYDPDALFSAIDATPNTALPNPRQVAQLTITGVTSGTAEQTDGSILTRTTVAWGAATDEAVRQSGRVEVQYFELGATLPTGDWPSVEAEGSATEATIVGLRSGRWYWVRVRARTSLGVRGKWSPAVPHQVALPPSVAQSYLQEATPTGMTVGAIWTKPSTGEMKRWDGTAWVLAANIGLQSRQYRAIASGNSATTTPAPGAGLYNAETGASLSGVARSYIVNVINKVTGAAEAPPGGVTSFDVYGSPSEATAMATALNALAVGTLVLVRSFDEPQTNRLAGGLPDAMYRCGASRAGFGSTQFKSRSAYILVGIVGCGEGNGFEAYQGDVDSDPDAWVDVSFLLTQSGQLIVSGMGYTPRTLADYGYSGALDATNSVRLAARGNCVLSGNNATKVGGVSAWDSDVYSVDAYVGGAYAAAVTPIGGHFMFGLSDNPLADGGYTSIDFAIHGDMGSGKVYAFELGSGVEIAPSWTPGALGAVLYDGNNVYYMLNGSLLHTTPNVGAGRKFHFDSSLPTPGLQLNNIQFGPQSSVSNIGTPQLQDNAATVPVVLKLTADTPVGTTETSVLSGSIDTNGRPLHVWYEYTCGFESLVNPGATGLNAKITTRIKIGGVTVRTLEDDVEVPAFQSFMANLSPGRNNGTISIPSPSTGAVNIEITMQAAYTEGSAATYPAYAWTASSFFGWEGTNITALGTKK